MKLNHLNLTVSDVLGTYGLLEKHFGMKGFSGMKPTAALAFMSDDNGMVLSLFRASKGADVRYPSGFHIGFVQESEERVTEINQRLREMASMCRNRAACTARGRFTSTLPAASWSKCCVRRRLVAEVL
jgi:hypothetical protein